MLGRGLHPWSATKGETGIRTNDQNWNMRIGNGTFCFSAALELMEIEQIEIDLKQHLACRICNYVDQIDEIMTCSIGNLEHKSSKTKNNAEADKIMEQNLN